MSNGHEHLSDAPGVGPAPLRILLVDDHVMVRAGLRALLDGEPDLDVVGETGDGTAAVRLAIALRPDVALMDLRLDDEGAGPGGIDTTRRLTAAVPDCRVVVLTSYGSQADVLGAVRAGAHGYVLKAGAPEELFRAIRTAAAGGMALAPRAAAGVVGQLVAPTAVLTDREVQVVRLLARGRSNRQLADALFLTEATVKTHLVRIYRKLGADNRAGAVAQAMSRGIIESG
jgi:DNA-binding NarL/FixJ family response regulator